MHIFSQPVVFREDVEVVSEEPTTLWRHLYCTAVSVEQLIVLLFEVFPKLFILFEETVDFMAQQSPFAVKVLLDWLDGL